MQVLFILAVTVAGIYGQCPPFDAAVQCPDADAGFVADACDKTCFYTCEKPDEDFTAVKRCCRACESWSQDVLTCQPDDSLPGCDAETTTVMDNCTLLEGSNKYSFVLGDTMMVCPSGTVFNLTECKCVSDPDPVYSPMKAAITCITFSQGWNGLSASKGVYAAASNVAVVADCTPAGGACGYFSAALGSSMNIPLFSNSYDAFSQFSVSLWFKRTPGKAGRQGLVGNGDCGASSSIGLMSEDENVVSVELTNAFDDDFSAAGLAADDDVFHHLAVVYDGSSIMVFVDGTNVAAGVFRGKIKRVYYPMIIGSCMCGSCNFDGYMDSISFAKVAFSPADVASLASNVGLCMPGP